MKVYDGVGLIADKSGAMVVPVKIDGLEATPFSRLSRTQVHRRWFPKVTITVLPPVKLAVADELKGRWRRQAAGAALYEIMSDLLFRTTDTDRTVFQAVVDAAEVHGWKRIAVEDPVTGSLTYKRMLLGANILGRKLMPLASEGQGAGRDATERERRGRDDPWRDVGRARARDDQLHRRRSEHSRRL